MLLNLLIFNKSKPLLARVKVKLFLEFSRNRVLVKGRARTSLHHCQFSYWIWLKHATSYCLLLYALLFLINRVVSWSWQLWITLRYSQLRIICLYCRERSLILRPLKYTTEHSWGELFKIFISNWVFLQVVLSRTR